MGSQSVIQNDANGARPSGHTEADRSQVVRIKGVTMRRHFVSHRWVWLAIAITVVVANELVDRNFFDHREHIDGDVVVTLLLLLVSFFGSFAAAALLRRRRRAAA